MINPRFFSIYLLNSIIAQIYMSVSAVAEETKTNAITTPMPSNLLLGFDGDSWDRGLITAVILAAIAAIAVGLTTAGSAISHKREAERAKGELVNYKLEVEGKVADAKREGIAAGKMAGDAMLRAAKIEAENLKLTQAINPRRLDESRLTNPSLGLIGSSLIGKKIFVSTYVLDTEAATYAYQIISALENSGVAVINGVLTTPSQNLRDNFELGVHIEVPDVSTKTKISEMLDMMGVQWYENQNLVRELNYKPILELGDAIIFVGAKPISAIAPTAVTPRNP